MTPGWARVTAPAYDPSIRGDPATAKVVAMIHSLASDSDQLPEWTWGGSNPRRAAGGLDQLRALLARGFGVATRDPGQRNDPGDDRDGHGTENHEVQPEHGDHAVDLTSPRVGSHKKVVPAQGLEPWTKGLRVPCSTN